MLHTIQILSLRDFALEHLPKVRALRELNARNGKHAAEETVADASRTFLLDPLATAIERQALRLLDFIHLHPKTHWTTHYLKELLDDDVIEEQKRELEQALENQPLCEQRILKEARLLNGLSGVPLPPWLAQAGTPAAAIEIQSDTLLVWSDARKLELLEKHDKLTSEKHKSPTKALASENKVSDTVIRNRLSEARTLRSAAKKPATPFAPLGL